MKFLFSILAVLVSVSLYAQEETYVFDYVGLPSIDEPVNEDYIKKNALGSDVAVRLAQLREEYTWEQDGDLVDPGQKIIVEKPEIYYSIKKLNGFYKKAVKKKEIDSETAKSDFMKIIEIALSIRTQNTIELEAELQKTKEEEEVIKLFTERVTFY